MVAMGFMVDNSKLICVQHC